MMRNLGKSTLIDLTFPLAQDILPKLATKATKWVKSRKRSKRIDFIHFE